jgi:NCAIR mutase (PurE)-related protein
MAAISANKIYNNTDLTLDKRLDVLFKGYSETMDNNFKKIAAENDARIALAKVHTENNKNNQLDKITQSHKLSTEQLYNSAKTIKNMYDKMDRIQYQQQERHIAIQQIQKDSNAYKISVLKLRASRQNNTNYT